MVFPRDHVPVWAVIEVRLLPTVGYGCDGPGCLSDSGREGGGGSADVPLAVWDTATASWLLRLDAGREEGRGSPL